MYSTCLFCHRPLGANEIVEHFPVGRRLAFDSAKGRLWVVCAKCEQWNLTPLEERWEAVEDCERIYRDARRRVSTDQIGLARVADRMDLIRIGEPLRPEFAAWRYGGRLRSRRRRAIVAGAATLGFVGGIVAFGGVAGPLASAGSTFVGLRRLLNRRSELGRAEKSLQRIFERHAGPARGSIEVRLGPGPTADGWSLLIAGGNATVRLDGSEALHTAHLVLPAVNPHGASFWSLRRAVSALEEVRDPERYFARALAQVRSRGLHYSPIGAYPAAVRIALEMAAHEESERRAMQGELATLEQSWREAEEIAGIADDLLLPAEVEDSLARLRRSSHSSEPS